MLRIKTVLPKHGGGNVRLSEAKGRITELETKVADLEKDLKAQLVLTQSWSDKWIESERAKGPAMADGIERTKLEKILRIIGYMTSGKVNEAVQELLEPMPVVIGLDIRFADDKSRIASEDEQLEKVKQLVTTAVSGVKIQRESAA